MIIWLAFTVVTLLYIPEAWHSYSRNDWRNLLVHRCSNVSLVSLSPHPRVLIHCLEFVILFYVSICNSTSIRSLDTSLRRKRFYSWINDIVFRCYLRFDHWSIPICRHICKLKWIQQLIGKEKRGIR